MKINGIEFNKIPNKKLGTQISTIITQSNVNNQNNEDYIGSENHYKLFNIIDVDFNGLVIEGQEINDITDFIKIILQFKEEITKLKNEIKELQDNLEAEYSSDSNGDVQLYNP